MIEGLKFNVTGQEIRDHVTKQIFMLEAEIKKVSGGQVKLANADMIEAMLQQRISNCEFIRDHVDTEETYRLTLGEANAIALIQESEGMTLEQMQQREQAIQERQNQPKIIKPNN